MRSIYKKTDFPVDKIRKYLEPGPIVLVSSSWNGQENIMTMGWHTVLEFTPSLIGCMISAGNHSFDMIVNSGECVINIPEVQLTDEVIGIGNCTGKDTDKFRTFGLTAQKSMFTGVPLIKECYANYECKIKDRRMIQDYNFFIFEVVKAHSAVSPQYPKTIHYRGEGVFMVSGRHIEFPGKFRPENL